jgi:hypothetical protein
MPHDGFITGRFVIYVHVVVMSPDGSLRQDTICFAEIFDRHNPTIRQHAGFQVWSP